MSLKGKRVLVTGATGFIGGRLVEKLVQEEGADVVALVRNWSGCARIARMPVEIVKGDLCNPDDVDAAMADCTVVFHLAFDPTGEKVNTDAIANLAGAAMRHRIHRFVHVGTVSVYEPLPAGEVSEASPKVPNGQFYADTKLAIENTVLQLAETDAFPAVIIQPTIVYGPYCKPWTDGPAKQLLSGKVILPDGGNGICNAVYVDDVVQALVKAATAEGVAGKRFLISGPGATTWREFYESIAAALDVEPPACVPKEDIDQLNSSFVSNVKLLAADPKRILLVPGMRPVAMWAKEALGDGAKTILKKLFGKYRSIAPRPVYLPDGNKLELFSSRGIVVTERATRALDYSPEFDFSTGMSITASYLRWAYLDGASE